MRTADLFEPVYNTPRGGRPNLSGYSCRYCGHYAPKVSTVAADMLAHVQWHLAKQELELLGEDTDGPRFRLRFGYPPQRKATHG